MDTLREADVTASIHYIARFLKSGIPICNFEVLGTAGRKMKRRRSTQAIAKRFVFHADAIKLQKLLRLESSGKTIHVKC